MTDAPPFLRVENVGKTFEGDGAHRPSIHVIDDVSMDIAAAEFIVYLGPSGCGKTTLMRIVGGLEVANAGAVYLGGEKVTGPDRRKGMVFQAYTSFPWLTVLENIRFGTRYRNDIGGAEKEEVSRHYLALVGLDDFANYYVNRISGGMRQRVAIARTLAAAPDILLMDEPFSALDPLIRSQLQDELIELQQRLNKTILFVSHDLDEALKIGTNIAIMESAQIIQHGKPEEIVLNPSTA